jgi:arylsulfatase A
VAAFGRAPKDHAELEQAPFLQLFDLETDPGETNNVAAQNPDLVAKLIGEFRTVLKRGRSTPGPALENGRDLKVFAPVPGFVWK